MELATHIISNQVAEHDNHIPAFSVGTHNALSKIYQLAGCKTAAGD